MRRCRTTETLMAITTGTATHVETVQVRRISWQSLWKLRPDLRPANDNDTAYTSPNSSSFAAVGRRS